MMKLVNTDVISSTKKVVLFT